MFYHMFCTWGHYPPGEEHTAQSATAPADKVQWYPRHGHSQRDAAGVILALRYLWLHRH
jgi:hypothetical protein